MYVHISYYRYTYKLTISFYFVLLLKAVVHEFPFAIKISLLYVHRNKIIKIIYVVFHEANCIRQDFYNAT